MMMRAVLQSSFHQQQLNWVPKQLKAARVTFGNQGAVQNSRLSTQTQACWFQKEGNGVLILESYIKINIQHWEVPILCSKFACMNKTVNVIQVTHFLCGPSIFWTTVKAKGFQLLETVSFLTSAPFETLVACKQRRLELFVVVPTNLEVVGQIHTAGRW